MDPSVGTPCTGKGLCTVAFDEQALLEDAVQSVCLLLEDGIEVTFAHRSFQEYFVARFIQASMPEVRGRLVERIAPTSDSDSVMGLLHELDAYSVERYYLLPRLAELRKRIRVGKKCGITHYVRFVQTLFGSFRVKSERGSGLTAMIEDRSLFDAVAFVWGRYAELKSTTAGPNPSLEELAAVFVEEYSAGAIIRTKSLKTTSRIIKALRQSDLLWGMAAMKHAFRVEDAIRARHATSLKTLKEVLTV